MIEAAAKAGAKGIVSAGTGRPTPRKMPPSTSVSKKPACSCACAAASPQDASFEAPACKDAASSPATTCSRGKHACCSHWR